LELVDAVLWNVDVPAGIKGCFMNIGFDKLAEYFSQVKPLVKHQQPLPASLINATQE